MPSSAIPCWASTQPCSIRLHVNQRGKPCSFESDNATYSRSWTYCTSRRHWWSKAASESPGVGMRQLLGQLQRLTALGQGLIWIPEDPEHIGQPDGANHLGISPPN